MNTARDQAIASGRSDSEDEQQDGRRQVIVRDGNAIYNYHGPVSVNHIGQAYNPNFGANHGYMNQTMYHNPLPMRSGREAAGGPVQTMAGADIFTLLNPILDASHTRNMKLSPPNSRCLPGTRREVIGDIQAWADSDGVETDPHILWIYGYAGCGKSAIAHEIAKDYADQGRLAACFVFFRGSGDRSTVARLATTIANQISVAIPETEPIIERIVRKSPGLLSTATTTLSDQFEHLVYQPIIHTAAHHRLPFLIVLDGVDECRDRDDVSTLIEDMATYFDRHPGIPLRFLIASRVEDHLHQVLHSSHQVTLLNLVERTSTADIAAALDVAIENAKRGRLLACNESWPDEWDRRRLVQHIGGSLLFMTIVVKRLFDRDLKDGLTPMDRLPLVLSMKANFDDLYREILIPWQGLPHFHTVISTIALAFEPLSVVQLADILAIKTANVVNVLINLQAILQVPGDDRTPVTLWHTSLRDYLSSEDRSGPLFAKPSHHLWLACRCASLAAASVKAKDSPSSEYSRSYAIEHLAKLVETTGASTDLLVPELRGIMNVLQIPVYKGNQTALEVACCGKHWKLVCTLVDAGANVNTRFVDARQDGIVCALQTACHYGGLQVVYFLLARGADPNIVSFNDVLYGFSDGTPLAFAALRGDVKLAARLLECGANPNLQGGYWSTAVQAACWNNSLEMVNLLLDHGADSNLQSGPYNKSPLHTCADIGRYDCARTLLMRKADPNIQDSYGNTPLHAACSWGKGNIVECLLEFGADTSVRNIKGLTAMQVAREEK